MKIQYLNGGLANQAFQYIFARYAELHNPTGEKFFLDDSFFFVNDVHNGYELEKVFGIKANLLSRHFDTDVWDILIENKRNGISIPQSIKNMGFDLKMIAESANYPEHNPFDGEVASIACNEFHPNIGNIAGDLYYHGYWINRQYFDAARDVLKKELSFSPLNDAANIEYASQITNTDSVFIHVRRGDFVTLHWSLDSEFYRFAVDAMRQEHPSCTFYIFSDDPDWCRSNPDYFGLEDYEQIVYVEGNEQGKNYIDMQLMGLCRNGIMSNSSFCYLAVLLSDHLETVINPTSRKI